MASSQLFDGEGMVKLRIYNCICLYDKECYYSSQGYEMDSYFMFVILD
jgi:hypothetical protein